MAVLSEHSHTARRSERVPVPSVLRQLLGATLLGLAVTCSPPVAPAQTPAVTEYEIKAAFLYNFAKFVEWPPAAFADPGSPLVIGVLGDDPFESDLDHIIEGKTANDRPLVIKRSKRLEDLRACHILFISASESGHLAAMLNSLRTASVLTVGETDQFILLGGVINFIERENKVHFVINLEAAQRTTLKISSKLLKVADMVIGRPEAGR
jgi:hypothetical protein